MLQKYEVIFLCLQTTLKMLTQCKELNFVSFLSRIQLHLDRKTFLRGNPSALLTTLVLNKYFLYAKPPML